MTRDVTSGSITDGPDPTCVYFVADTQAPSDMAFLVRSRADSLALRGAVASAMNAIAPGAAFRVTPMPDLLGTATWVFGALSATAGVLGIVGLVLACSGTYGVISYLVAMRTREFGIRMAIGASGTQIVTGMLREACRTGGYGMALGVLATFALSRLSSGHASIIPELHVASYALGIAAVGVATAAAAALPARRAARIDPMRALRVD